MRTKAEKDLQEYKNHVNYKSGYPNPRDSVVSYILREVAMVISPPKEEGESHERKCEDIANAILTMENELSIGTTEDMNIIIKSKNLQILDYLLKKC